MRPLSDFQSFLNERVNTLTIYSLHGRDNKGAPIHLARCETCGTANQSFSHEQVKRGSIRCKVNGCGRSVIARRTAKEVPIADVLHDAAMDYLRN
jgi:hypothetical protein